MMKMSIAERLLKTWFMIMKNMAPNLSLTAVLTLNDLVSSLKYSSPTSRENMIVTTT